jgi:GNAT superfamily N-acetyltransferase
VLRRATLDDVDALAHLHHATVSVAYREWFPPPAPAVEVLRPLWEADLRDAHAVLAWGDVGSVVARANGDLARLHVHPSRWGEGIGRRLHDAAVAELRERGHQRAGLWVIERNERARALYERSGWTVVDGEVFEELGVREVRYVLDL